MLSECRPASRVPAATWSMAVATTSGSTPTMAYTPSAAAPAADSILGLLALMYTGTGATEANLAARVRCTVSTALITWGAMALVPSTCSTAAFPLLITRRARPGASSPSVAPRVASILGGRDTGFVTDGNSVTRVVHWAASASRTNTSLPVWGWSGIPTPAKPNSSALSANRDDS